MASPYSQMLEQQLADANRKLAALKKIRRGQQREKTASRYAKWKHLRKRCNALLVENQTLQKRLADSEATSCAEIERERARWRLARRAEIERDAARRRDEENRTRRTVSVGVTQQMRLVIEEATAMLNGRLAGVPKISDNDTSDAAQYARYYRVAGLKLVEQLRTEMLVEMNIAHADTPEGRMYQLNNDYLNNVGRADDRDS